MRRKRQSVELDMLWAMSSKKNPLIITSADVANAFNSLNQKVRPPPQYQVFVPTNSYLH